MRSSTRLLTGSCAARTETFGVLLGEALRGSRHPGIGEELAALGNLELRQPDKHGWIAVEVRRREACVRQLRECGVLGVEVRRPDREDRALRCGVAQRGQVATPKRPLPGDDLVLY